MKNSVVRIGNARGSGTGFIVSQEGHILTAWHVIDLINRRGDPNSKISYVRSAYRVAFADDESRCGRWADLVGASDYRDVAVLQLRAAGESGGGSDGCVQTFAPVVIDWHLDPATRTSQPVYPYINEAHYPIGFPAKCADWASESPTWSGENCPLRGVNAFRTTLRRPTDEWGLLELEQSVEHGYSGGPVVLDNGRVVGMAVLRDWEDQNPVTRLVASPMLELPLWTFGVAVDKERSVLTDHFESVLDYISRREEIVTALDAFDKMYEFLSIPELLYEEAEFKSVMTDRGELIFPNFAFERRWANAPNPTRFEVTHTCVPRDEKIRSLFVGEIAAGIVEKERQNDIPFYEMVPPPSPSTEKVVGASAGEGAAPSQSVRYEIQPSSSQFPVGVDRSELLRACGRMHRGAINELADKLNLDPDLFFVQTSSGDREELPQAQVLRELTVGEAQPLDPFSAYSEILFFVVAVYEEGGTAKLRHTYKPIAIPLDQVRDDDPFK